MSAMQPRFQPQSTIQSTPKENNKLSLSFNFTPTQMAVIYCHDDPDYLIDGKTKSRNTELFELTPHQKELRRKFQILIGMVRKKQHSSGAVAGRVNGDRLIEAARDYFTEGRELFYG